MGDRDKKKVETKTDSIERRETSASAHSKGAVGGKDIEKDRDSEEQAKAKIMFSKEFDSFNTNIATMITMMETKMSVKFQELD